MTLCNTTRELWEKIISIWVSVLHVQRYFLKNRSQETASLQSFTRLIRILKIISSLYDNKSTGKENRGVEALFPWQGLVSLSCMVKSWMVLITVAESVLWDVNILPNLMVHDKDPSCFLYTHHYLCFWSKGSPWCNPVIFQSGQLWRQDKEYKYIKHLTCLDTHFL